MYYVFSLTGYEDYKPFWFDCDCSEEEFKKAVRDSIDIALESMLAEESDCLVCGYVMADCTAEILQTKYGFKLLNPELEVSVFDYYSESTGCPDVMRKETFDKIMEHNKQVTEDMYRDM
jgi:hypothetical protein